MNNQPKKELSTTAAFVIFGIFILMASYVCWNYFFNQQSSSVPCTRVTRSTQAINKLDGDVVSVENGTVDGCEYPDGTFIPAPDLQ